MNAGAYKKETKDIIKEVEVLDDGVKKVLPLNDIEFGYRSSIFQNNPKVIIIGATFKLIKSNKESIIDLMEDRFKRRKNTQPLDKYSAGSCFRNGEDYFVWELIDDIGYRGYKINDIEVSSKHPNFIINNGNGTAEDFIKVLNDIEIKVKEKHNIDLIEEVEKFNC